MTPLRTDLPPGAQLPPRPANAPAPGTVLPSHYVRCFACGDQSAHGLHLRVDADAGLALCATFEVTEHHQGAPGLAHGGLLSCALDEALGALGHLTRTSLVTGRLETDFLRPVPVGTVLHLSARVEGVLGRRVYASGEGRLNSPTGRVAVRARGLFVEVPMEHFVTHARAEDIQAIEQDPDLIRLREHQTIF
ncbi:thioesterase [Frankia sp. CcI156]|uniref:PaaI family thioesterase n=1 Tax=Frankia sp. CgS1 TaxID=1745381 RepID=UPI000674CAA8|nr:MULTISPECIES: PaaI family thioesterase [unclassified Frankia]OHV57904.1 thioesterase [Frankia sp. CgIS1]ONH29324.1 thioesterase [Frankia sp. CcI156]ORT56930.1 thioesterase [Frankia sp. KB5]